MLSRFGRRCFPLAGCILPVTLTVAAPKPLGVLQLEHTALAVTVVADNFKEPIDLAFGPDGFLWCTELVGVVWRIDPATGERKEVLRIPDVFYRKSHGLLSLVHHPHFATEPWAYLHYVYQVPTAPRTRSCAHASCVAGGMGKRSEHRKPSSMTSRDEPITTAHAWSSVRTRSFT